MICVRLTTISDGDISGHGLRDCIGGAGGLNVGVSDEQRTSDRRVGTTGDIRHHLHVPRCGHIARLERREVEPIRLRLAYWLAIEHRFTRERVRYSHHGIQSLMPPSNEFAESFYESFEFLE